MPWKVVVGQTTGLSHAEASEPCQDACRWRTVDETLIAAVSDGAGSAVKGGQGAAILCETVVQTFSKALLTKQPPTSSRLAYRLAAHAIRTARREIQTQFPSGYHTPNSTGLQDFHATLVASFIKESTGYFFHIGDGVAVATHNESWDACVISQPENGRFSDETFFFTEDEWQMHLRITQFSQSDLILLMTDGVTPFAIAPNGTTLHEPFIKPISAYLAQNDDEIAAEALSATLNSRKAQALNLDDKTLLWARRITENENSSTLRLS